MPSTGTAIAATAYTLLMRDTSASAPLAPGSSALALVIAGQRVRSASNEALAEHDLSLRLMAPLGHLTRDPGLSYSELARRSSVTPQSMQATLDRLESMGAVARRTEPGRGRVARLEVTQRGTQLLNTATDVVSAVDWTQTSQ